MCINDFGFSSSMQKLQFVSRVNYDFGRQMVSVPLAVGLILREYLVERCRAYNTILYIYTHLIKFKTSIECIRMEDG